ncbi:MAG: protein-glutamate O-methyltransferase CheR [Peptococcaceae bacterium]|nr:protein-glutamate O-methyltransferase CheR [Peptococcaceae bacterium]
MSINGYDDFKSFFKLRSGLDLNCYKPAQMQRRIEQFMHNRRFDSYVSFKQALDKDSMLMQDFFKHLTINVSQFFRDTNQWQVLRERILPTILKDKSTVKIWSAGCSSGQEAYTLATTLNEFFSGRSFSILATDIDPHILEYAKRGVYSVQELKDVPPILQSKYFKQHPAGMEIVDKLRQNIVFKQHNLLTDSFQSDFDLILCRNVVIYFTEETKQVLYQRFAGSLRTGGFLFTGSTEQIFNLRDLNFTAFAPFFYRKGLPTT